MTISTSMTVEILKYKVSDDRLKDTLEGHLWDIYVYKTFRGWLVRHGSHCLNRKGEWIYASEQGRAYHSVAGGLVTFYDDPTEAIGLAAKALPTLIVMGVTIDQYLVKYHSN
jgi:hypothetical protein